MNRNVKLVVIFGLFLFPAIAAAGGLIPESFSVKFPFEGSYIVRSELSGAGTYEGLGASWTVNDYSAQIVFDGFYTATNYSPNINLFWYFLGDTLPLNVNVTSNNGGEYHIIPGMQPTSGESVDVSLAQWFVVGDSYFGHYFPDMYMFYIQITLESPNIIWDMTIDLEWGPGVPTEQSTLDSVKSLYR